MRSNNGGEFVNRKFAKLCEEDGIIHQTMIAYNPQQNGVAERYNRTILERTRCMLIDSDLPEKFWTEVVNTAVYFINRIPKGTEKESDFEKWNGTQPTILNLRIFGEAAYMSKGEKRQTGRKMRKIYIFEV